MWFQCMSAMCIGFDSQLSVDYCFLFMKSVYFAFVGITILERKELREWALASTSRLKIIHHRCIFINPNALCVCLSVRIKQFFATSTLSNQVRCLSAYWAKWQQVLFTKLPWVFFFFHIQLAHTDFVGNIMLVFNWKNLLMQLEVWVGETWQVMRYIVMGTIYSENLLAGKETTIEGRFWLQCWKLTELKCKYIARLKRQRSKPIMQLIWLQQRATGLMTYTRHHKETKWKSRSRRKKKNRQTDRHTHTHTIAFPWRNPCTNNINTNKENNCKMRLFDV